MKPKQITYEQALTMHSIHSHTFMEGYNEAISDMEQHRKEKKSKRRPIKFTPEFIETVNNWKPDESSIPAIIKTNNRIIELAEKFKAEIVRLQILNDKQNFRIAQLEQFNKNQVVTDNVNVKYLKNYDNRISELEKRLASSETYNIDEEIKKIHAVVQAHDQLQAEDDARIQQLEDFNFCQVTTENTTTIKPAIDFNDRLTLIETQIRVIHAGDTPWQQSVITTGSAVDIKGIGSTIISQSK